MLAPLFKIMEPLKYIRVNIYVFIQCSANAWLRICNREVIKSKWYVELQSNHFFHNHEKLILAPKYKSALFKSDLIPILTLPTQSRTRNSKVGLVFLFFAF
jgi:hypothetical protein